VSKGIDFYHRGNLTPWKLIFTTMEYDFWKFISTTMEIDSYHLGN